MERCQFVLARAGDLLSPSKSWQQSPALGQAVLAQLSHSTSVHRPHSAQLSGAAKGWRFLVFLLIISGDGSGNGGLCIISRIQLQEFALSCGCFSSAAVGGEFLFSTPFFTCFPISVVFLPKGHVIHPNWDGVIPYLSCQSKTLCALKDLCIWKGKLHLYFVIILPSQKLLMLNFQRGPRNNEPAPAGLEILDPLRTFEWNILRLTNGQRYPKDQQHVEKSRFLKG